jgi:DNA-binding transcriptional ArsR family regulator
MATLLAIFGSVGVVLAAAGAAAVFGTYHSMDDEGCAVRDTVTYGGTDARPVQVRLENTGSAQTVRLCVLDGSGVQRYVDKVDLPAQAAYVFKVDLPGSATRIGLELDRPGWGMWDPYAILGAGGPVTADCGRGIPQHEYRTEFGHSFSGIRGPTVSCARPDASLQSLGGFDHSAPLVSEPQAPLRGVGLGAAIASALALGAAVVAVVWRRPLRLLALGLFTRLVQPRLLDHVVRAKIVEAVNADPGVNANTIARRLGLARGVAMYHLAVLERERVLNCVRPGRQRHYFPRGTLAPREMMKISLLRRAHAEDLYRIVAESPGIGAGELARRLGVSASRVTHLVDRLAREGLIERARDGRFVRLRALTPDASS